ncbi:hypothetical protein THAOC_36564, partial [Thalassiosira oceanica]
SLLGRRPLLLAAAAVSAAASPPGADQGDDQGREAGGGQGQQALPPGSGIVIVRPRDPRVGGGRHRRRSARLKESGTGVRKSSVTAHATRPGPPSSSYRKAIQANIDGEGPGTLGTREAKMKICGACERTLPDDSYSEEQRGRRQSIRRCDECVAAGNQLVLMRKGRKRSEEDECPICNLPLPLDVKQTSFRSCCMKEVCNGCTLAAFKRGMRDCPFCRTTALTDGSQCLPMIQKRADSGDPVAIYHLGNKYHLGQYGLEKDTTRAVELYEHAAELGEKDAHYNLGCLYDEGVDVEKNTPKAIRHWEAAAMLGHVSARFNLGNEEGRAGNVDLALQHWLISANLGHGISLDNVKKMFMSGLTAKADYARALRGYQSATEEMSSPDRNEAKALRS